MPTLLRPHAGVATALALLAQAAAAAEPEVQWLRYELPPLYITQGPLQDRGVLDQALARLLPRLAGYQHRIVTVPPKRMEASLRSLPNACAFGMLKNAERESFLTFSTPFPIHVAPGLMVRRADLAALAPLRDARGRLSLQGWLNNPELKLGLAEGRAYGAAVDDVIAALPAGRVERLSSQNPALNLLRMLELGRVDGVLMLPFEPAALAAAHGLKLDELRLLALVEQTTARHGHVACARGELGAAIVRRANTVLAEPAWQQGLSSGSASP
ncbi:TIGR02285 family protein [Roseateles sp. DXS20W]|uniref:TIGR02285 family protein n=1 Tax=Pelomonas lactea TaxID=3299030 RepID=A0ABW7GE69_9BURK